MSNNDDTWNEEQFRSLFAAASGEGPPPDEEFLRRLREESAAAFAASQVHPTKRRSKMLLYTSRVAASVVAASIAVAAWFFAGDSTRKAPNLGQALDRLAAARSVHFQVTLDGKATEAWASQPGLLRWNLPDGTYQIARGDRAWLIDEKANRAASKPASCFRDGGRALDPVGFLLTANLVGQVDDAARRAVLDAKPTRHETRDGAECDLYEVSISSAGVPLLIEAVVDCRTGLLGALSAKTDRRDKFVSLAAIRVLAVDGPVPEELFVVGETLTEDGRIGKVAAAQGLCAVRPPTAERWTPLGEGALVMPGDWLRTDLRGANAATVGLVGQTRLTLGPGTLVELVSPKSLRVFTGDVKIAAPEKSPVEVAGPDKVAVSVVGTRLFRIANEKLVGLEKEPLWLAGFEGRAVGESIGSLVANIDGRNTPLTVGYHKVTVDIRDQIARTTVEESFVNHTNTRLEGVFHFPLPPDASISGFGMWIGSELVEADVVEKQRAREIYETILRERRDPGLLEWSGGNIFKARVFPIEAQSEKRIKISYTQVLPRRGSGYGYSYALQSELLKQHPLRELAIDVKLNSAAPLRGVTSPTHPVRVEQTAHSARVEFSAQEYTPTRDFEVVAELEAGQSELELLPYRRGEDGYFMAILTPPALQTAEKEGQSAPSRDVLPEGEPLDLLILADTSASLDRSARTAQGEFIAALLGSLAPKDRINLACCDVECDWVFEQSVPAEAKNLDAARESLGKRASLGWTDLDNAFSSAFAKAGPKTRILYVGDGIVTTGDADPVAFGKRLRLRYQELPRDEGQLPTCHAVSVSSSYEAAALGAIASCGGGSVRQISGDRGPQAVARELLQEIARPALKDLKVEFRGLRVARVYPEELPNLPAGGQQILLGRYLPQGKEQSGEVVVTGTFDGRPIRYACRASLADDEQGNSFIPRLWARTHLDALLQQGASQAIQDEIIALSEEYHIITPYTSLLVLESDADRERFKVKRLFAIRDGEKFFAAGRDNVDYELTQQQMRRAGLWRLGLRRSVLAELSRLGRDASVFSGGERFTEGYSYHNRSAFTQGLTRLSLGGGGSVNGIVDLDFKSSGDKAWDVGSLFTSSERRSGVEELGSAEKPLSMENTTDLGRESWEREPFPEGALSRWDSESGGEAGNEPSWYSGAMEAGDKFDVSGEMQMTLSQRVVPVADSISASAASAWVLSPSSHLSAPLRYSLFAARGARSAGLMESTKYRRFEEPQFGDWLGGLFPSVPAVPAKVEIQEPKRPWPEEAKALAASLLRVEVLEKLPGGMRIERQSESYEPRYAELTSKGRALALVSPKAWLTRSEGSGSQTMLSWCDGKERGAIAPALQLGRLRAAEPADLELRAVGLGLDGWMLTALDQSFRETDVELEPRGENRVVLRITFPTQPENETRFLIDTARHVVLSSESLRDGKATSTTKYDDFVEVAGAWWPGRIESFDAKERRTSLVRQKLDVLAADALAAEIQKQLAGCQTIQFLREPLPTLLDAKRAIAAGKASFEDEIVLLDHFARSQQWTRVMDHLAGAGKLVADKPGVRWLRDAVLGMSRRHEELRTRIMEEAGRLAQSRPSGEDLFLADRLLNQSQGVLEDNEVLRLLDALKPLYQRQPAFTQAMKRWRERQVNCLRQTGQAEESRKLLGQLVADYPHDTSLLQQYASALAQIGEHETAFRLLREALEGETEWLPYEADSLRNTYCQLMQSEGRWAELADFLAESLKRHPESSSPYEQYLGALVRLDKVDEANALAEKWLAEGQAPGKLPPAEAARLQAAVNFMLGNCYGVYMDRLDQRWPRPLADAATAFARKDAQGHVADRIMGEWRFTRTDECRRVRKWAIETLDKEIEALNPGEVQRLVNWAISDDPAVEQSTWRMIAQRLRKRWDEEKKPDVRRQLAQPLVQVLSSRLAPEEWIGFLRIQWKEAPAEDRAGSARQLFDALIGQPWSQANEDEAFALLEPLSEGQKEPAVRLAIQLGALYQLTDRMIEARFQDKMKAVEHREKLTRIELRAKQTENRKAAYEGFADRLRQETPKHQGPIVAWLNAERIYCDVLTGRNLDPAVEDCREFLGPAPTSPLPPAEVMEILDRALQTRFLITLANLASRKNPPAGTADRLLEYVDAGIAAAAEDDLSWKLIKFQLLVALDRPKDLEKSLREWAAAEGPINPWRLALGYLLAEQGKLAEAISLFEAVAAADELGPAEHRTLADWYMAVGRRENCEKSMIAAYKTIEDWRLNNLLSQRLQPWQRRDGQVPTELDKEVLLVFAALFEKSTNPQNHLSLLQQFYRETHDFRLLACLTDAVTGHTAGQVYPFLQNMASVLGEVRDEPTADSIVEHLAKVRQRAATDVDRRALDLLEAIVERRAAEVINQSGPHVAKALAALQRAFARQWTAGEPSLMADFLASLGNITQPQLAAEQVIEVETLYQEAAAGTIDRLRIAKALASARWCYGKHDEAMALLQLELGDYQRARNGALPVEANDALGTLVSFFERSRHYARGEEVLFEQLKHPLNAQQREWLSGRLYALYEDALRNDGDVSLGRGAALFLAAAAKIEADLSTASPNGRQQLLNHLCSVYRVAYEKKLAGAADELRAFVQNRFSEFVKREMNDYASMVSQLANTVHDINGPLDALAFLVSQIEREPRWLRYSNQDAWQQHGWVIAQWRRDAKPLGDLEPRLLGIVLDELREDLRTRQSRNSSIYHRGNNDLFWADKEKDFARVVEEVYSEQKGSGAAVAYLAEYLYDGLAHYDRAIEILLAADRQGLLDEGAQSRLIQCLHMQNRHGESIAILLPLVERRPDNVQYRVWLMRAYFCTKQPDQLLAILKQSDEHFREDGRWTEGNLGSLAASCLENERFEQSVKYYQELIPMYERARPNRGIGDGTLSQHYRNLALAFAGLGNTADAVEAACGAIVSWGPQASNRAEALNTLRQVLSRSPDLDAYVRELDKQSAERGLDNPLVRKALGQTYLERGTLDKAAAQLKLAVGLQPNDAETQQALLACYDRSGDREGAIGQLLQSVGLSRRDAKLYEDLGRRYAELARPGEAERAYTSIVEMLANESESHAALAEIRQRQDRWDEAILQWQQVARLRALEPTGLLGLAEAQVHQKLYDDADASVRQLESRAWPSRFSDVQPRTWQLRQKIEQGRKGQ